MDLLGYARARDPVPLLGAGLFVGLLAGGYYYNITFVQLGLVDARARLLDAAADLARAVGLTTPDAAVSPLQDR